jgi:glycosyltransferase involved in cell wall biosynthesis
MKIILAVNSRINFKNSQIAKIGGIEHCNLELAHNLIKLGLDVKLACKIKREIKYRNLNIIPINYLLLKDYYKSCDFLISSNTSRFFYKQKKVTKILWLHNKLQIEKSIRKREFFSIFFNKPNCVFVSNYLKNNTSKMYPFSSKIVIPNGCSDLFLNNKRKYKKKPIFIWSIRRDRGLNEIITMWNKFFYKKEIKAELHIYGIKNSLSKKSNKDYSSKGIKFFGIVSRENLAKKYSYSTAMIHPGYDETFCISVLEGQASGLPTLTFDRTALSERVINKINGYKVKSFDEMGKKAIELVTNESKWLYLSNKSINLSKKYSWKSVAISWHNYLKKINLEKFN